MTRQLFFAIIIGVLFATSSSVGAQCIDGVCKIRLTNAPAAVRAPLYLPQTTYVPYQHESRAVMPRTYRTPIRSFLFGRANYPTPLRTGIGGNVWFVDTYRRQ